MKLISALALAALVAAPATAQSSECSTKAKSDCSAKAELASAQEECSSEKKSECSGEAELVSAQECSSEKKAQCESKAQCDSKGELASAQECSTEAKASCSSKGELASAGDDHCSSKGELATAGDGQCSSKGELAAAEGDCSSKKLTMVQAQLASIMKPTRVQGILVDGKVYLGSKAAAKMECLVRETTSQKIAAKCEASRNCEATLAANVEKTMAGEMCMISELTAMVEAGRVQIIVDEESLSCKQTSAAKLASFGKCPEFQAECAQLAGIKAEPKAKSECSAGAQQASVESTEASSCSKGASL